MDDPFAETRRLIAEWDLKHGGTNGDSPGNQPVDWPNLRDMDFDHDWLVEKFWPMGSHVHIFAAPKTGKSLLGLWMAGNLAIGRDPFTWEATTRRKVAYIDNEMTLRDVQERTNDMGFDFDALQEWLFYFSYPILAPMDTVSGGSETLHLMDAYSCDLLIIDTLSRVVKGEENSNDTYRNFYNHTGRLLKAHDKSALRFDHAGHDPKKSRGASAKADDVDLVFQLEKRLGKDESPGFRLTRTHARTSGISEIIDLSLIEDPTVSIKASHARTWSEGAIRKAKELDSINAPMGSTVRETVVLLKASGFTGGKTTVLTEAMKLRESRKPFGDLLS